MKTSRWSDRRKLTRVMIASTLGLLGAWSAGDRRLEAQAAVPAGPTPQWIWASEQRQGNVPVGSTFFRHKFNYQSTDRGCQLEIVADDEFALFVNGRMAGRGEGWQQWKTLDLTRFVRPGENLLAIQARNTRGQTAGVAAKLTVHHAEHTHVALTSGPGWKCSLSGLPGWNQVRTSDSAWKEAGTLGPHGTTRPWVVEPPTALAQVASGSKPVTVARKTDSRFRLAREFRIEHLGDHQSLGSLIAMTFDEAGQLIISQEDGPLLVADDADQDGTIDRTRVFADQMRSCQGLLCMNGNLYAIGTGPAGSGLYRLRDTDADGSADDVKRLMAFSDRMAEHGPHAIALGPDGMLYILLGNHTALPTDLATNSPYHNAYEGDLVQPRWSDPGGHADGILAPGGVVIRTDVEGKRVELVSGGLRNPYDLVFTDSGELFTHDADMESDVGMAWYRPTRILHLTDGSEFGWRSGWAKWPEYYLDSLPSAATTGRGSPAGAVVYDHRAFPPKYRGAIFLADWSEGRVLAAHLKPLGAGFTADTEIFLQGEPLNVTDIDVGPDGALYLVTGGRGTSGNLYRVSWRGAIDTADGSSTDGLLGALTQPQMQSAWARQKVATARGKLGVKWEELLESVCLSKVRPAHERVRALRLLKWFGPEPDRTLLMALLDDHQPAVRAEAAYYAGILGASASVSSDASIIAVLVNRLSDDDARVRRRACEALLKRQAPVSIDKFEAMLKSEDRFEAFAARRLLEAQPAGTWRDKVLSTDNLRLFLQGSTALLIAYPTVDNTAAIVSRNLELMQGFISDQDFVDVLRVFQLALHRHAPPAEVVADLRDQLAQEFPATDLTINRELVRLLSFLQADSITDRYLDFLAEDLPMPERIHAAMYLARIKAGWSDEQRLEMMRYLEIPENAGNSVPGYLQRASLEFGQQIAKEQFEAIMSEGHDHPGAALAVVLRLPSPLGEDHIQALAQLDDRVHEEETERFKRLKVAIVAMLARDGSDSAMEYLRQVYQRDPARRVEVALGLAQRPAGPNWPLVVSSLPLMEGAAARETLAKLREVRRVPSEADAYRQVILCGLRLGDQGADDAVALLEHWQGYPRTGEKIPWQRGIKAWQKWFHATYPNAPPASLTMAEQHNKWNYDDLLKHLTQTEHRQKASAERGAAIFKNARCAQCHRFGDVGESMGPDLTTVSRRFLTKEILDSIMYPSKVISDQYRAKTVTTTKGRVHTGLVSQGIQEMMVLSADGQKIRIPSGELDEVQPSPISAMPEGLLNSLRLEEVTDLFEYLQTTGRTSVARAAGERER